MATALLRYRNSCLTRSGLLYIEVSYIFLYIIEPINIVPPVIFMAVAFLFDQVFDLPRKYNSVVQETFNLV